ncbi:MAG: hypothetical protein WA116_07615 [Anaerolineaceae bacterium]
MQEIAPNIYIENNSLGLVTGVIRTEEGSILVDSPIRLDEQKSWRSGTARLILGEPRFLITLDTNYDRLLSAKGSDSVIIAQSNCFGQSRARSATTKGQEDLLGYSESVDVMNGGTRWFPPEISFQEDLSLFFGTSEINLEHHSGANNAGIWVILPKEKVIFVGDSVLVDQPPFLAYSDLDAWIEDLKQLGTKPFKGFQIISARSGLVNHEQVKAMERLITSIKHLLDPLMEENASLETVLGSIPKIMKRFEVSQSTSELYYNRLRWGMTTYYEQNVRS